MKALIGVALAGIAAPGFAQDHAIHGEEMPDPATQQAGCEAEAERHRAMGHGVPEGQCAPVADPSMDHGSMDHGAMGHGAMGHGAMGHGAMVTPIRQRPPPLEAGSGPARAADAIWGAKAMARSRSLLPLELGDTRYAWFLADRAEYRMREGADGYLWDVQGYYGTDTNKLWLKSEGEGSFGEDIEVAEVQALYSRAIAPWFDLQAGLRQDFAPRDRTYVVVGLQGLAPYTFEVDGAVFLSDRGDVTARIEGEIDQRITQRLILQPRAEMNLAAQDVPELGIGAGIDDLEAGLRLRYEITREFAPYIGVEQEWKLGGSRDYARAEGDDPSITNYVAGLRFWF